MGMVHLRHLRRERPERSDVHLPGASGHDRPVPNGFPPFFTTPSITVFVAVSQVKYAAFVSAGALTAVAGGILAAAAIAAAIIGVGDIAAAVFVGIASGFEAAALIAGGVAQDPPIEDRRYRLLYEPVAVRLPDTGEEIQPLVRFAQAVFAVIAHVEALGATDSRIAGARAARARKALENQTNHFEKVRKELPRLAREVRDALPDAAAFFSERSPTPAKADEAIQVLNHDLPLRAQMLTKGVAGRGRQLERLRHAHTTDRYARVRSGESSIPRGHSLLWVVRRRDWRCWLPRRAPRASGPASAVLKPEAGGRGRRRRELRQHPHRAACRGSNGSRA